MTAKQLRVELADLAHEPGARIEVRRDWTVPEGWATEVLTLPAGTVIPLNVEVTAIDDGVYVQLNAEGALVGECVRCLDPITVPWTISASEVFYEPGRVSKAPEVDADIESEGDELDEALQIDRESIDLEQVLRDEILAHAPLRPTCDENCLGLCEHCGVRLDEVDEDHAHEFLDPRFAALAGLFDKSNGSDAADDDSKGTPR